MAFALPEKTLITPLGVKTVGVPLRKFKFDECEDNKNLIFEKLGDLDDINLFFGQVVCAKFLRDKVSDSLIAAPQTSREDMYQGKIGLVLKVGPLAFMDRPGANFGGASVKRGDWVMYRASDGHDMDIRCLDGLNVVHARVVEDAEIKSTVKYPERIW